MTKQNKDFFMQSKAVSYANRSKKLKGGGKISLINI